VVKKREEVEAHLRRSLDGVRKGREGVVGEGAKHGDGVLDGSGTPVRKRQN